MVPLPFPLPPTRPPPHLCPFLIKKSCEQPSICFFHCYFLAIIKGENRDNFCKNSTLNACKNKWTVCNSNGVCLNFYAILLWCITTQVYFRSQFIFSLKLVHFFLSSEYNPQKMKISIYWTHATWIQKLFGVRSALFHSWLGVTFLSARCSVLRW